LKVGLKSLLRKKKTKVMALIDILLDEKDCKVEIFKKTIEHETFKIKNS
jgi:hypothetical protein